MLTCTLRNREEALPLLNNSSIAAVNLQAEILPCTVSMRLKVAEVEADFEVLADVMSCLVLCRCFCI